MTNMENKYNKIQNYQQNIEPEFSHNLNKIKEFLIIKRKEINLAHRSGESSSKIISSLSDLADRIVQKTIEIGLEHLNIDLSLVERISFCALGGYGRKELSPHSDLDICILYPKRLDESLIQLNRFLIHFLWDIGFKVGHSLMTIPEAIQLAQSDIKTSTSLLESRLICGNKELFADFKYNIKQLFSKELGKQFLQQKLFERFEGLSKEYSDLFAPEPDLKENAGGLRDYHTAIWLMMVFADASNLDEIVAQGHLTTDEQLEIAEALDFIWKIRNELHFYFNKAEDKLSYSNQQLLAEIFGYAVSEHSKSLLLMQDYYSAAVCVRRFLTDCARICLHPGYTAQIKKELSTSENPRGIFIENGVLFAGIHDKNWFIHVPARLMEVYWEAARRNAQLSRTTERAVSENLNLVTDAFRSNELVRRFFIAICNRPFQAGYALRQAANSGLLGKYIPEFEAVKGILRYQDFHHYPVDEHTLRAIEAISKIPEMEGTIGRCLQEAIEHLPDPYILVLAILCHDLGKIAGDTHLSESIRLTKQICERIGLSEEDIHRVQFLVQHHLLMNTLSQWRDIDDEHIVQNFVKIVKTEERLRGLFLLSFADLYAVGPNVWNEWKGALLLQLYLRAVKRLLGRAETLDEEYWHSEKAKQIEQYLPHDLHNQVEFHIKSLGQRYFLAFPPNQIAEHIQLIEKAKIEGLSVHCRDDHTNAQSIVVICTRDRQGLFSYLAGSFCSQLIDVNSAAVFTRADGFIVDCFYVSDVKRQRPLTRTQVKTLEKVLREVLLEGRDLTQLVEQAKNRLFALFQPKIQTQTRIFFDNESSQTETVIDVETGDRTGLLYDITRAISEEGLNITTARIITDARRVRDSFYVNKNGNKITSLDEQERIRERLHQAIHPRGIAYPQIAKK